MITKKQLLIIYVFSYIHSKGWCKTWHRSKYIQKISMYGECHLVDKIMLILYPQIPTNYD